MEGGGGTIEIFFSKGETSYYINSESYAIMLNLFRDDRSKKQKIKKRFNARNFLVLLQHDCEKVVKNIKNTSNYKYMKV